MDSRKKISGVPWPQMGSIYNEKEVKAVTTILRNSGAQGVWGGVAVDRFEKAFAEYVGAKHAIAVNSCGTALDICTKILEIKDGDEVITTPLTFKATATSILLAGGIPVFADIDSKTYNIDPKSIEQKITGKTKAIYPVHYSGLAADMQAIKKIAEKHSLSIVADAAHALGTKYKDRDIGSIAEMTCYSFQNEKNITTLGEGGMITTNNKAIDYQARQLRTFSYYVSPTSKRVIIGTNNRMLEVQAAAGLVQLKKIEALTVKRRRAAHYLTEKLEAVEGIAVPCEGPGDRHTYHLYTLLFNDAQTGCGRNKFLQILREQHGIGGVPHYPACYDLEVFSALGYKVADCPVAGRVCRQLFNLPIHPSFRKEQLNYMIEAVKKTVDKLKSKSQAGAGYG